MNVFQKIIAGEVPATIVWEDDEIVAFRDIQPQAPVHILIVPKKVILNISCAEECHATLLGRLLLTAAHLARAENISDTGFRLVINNGLESGQTIPHLHIHLLGGRSFAWPPG